MSIIVQQDANIYSLYITVITVICAPDDGWRYHPKHVEQFTEIS